MGAAVRKLRSQAAATSPSQAHNLATGIWGIDWTKHFPAPLKDTGLTVEHTTYDEALPFIQANFSEIYSSISRGNFHERFDQDAKARFYRNAGDFFIFRDENGEPCGVAVCNPTDWSTYYFRNISMLPRVQGRGAYQAFFAYLALVLRDYGIQRIEGDIAPSNLPHIHAVTKVGLHVTGLNLSDRWGAMLHFTLFLNEADLDTFNGHFCEIVRKLK